MNFIERITFLLFLIGLLFLGFDLDGGAFFTGISLSILACLYFYLGFALFNGLRFRKLHKKTTYSDLTWKSIVLSLFAGIFLSILLVGIMFKILKLEGALIQTSIGLIGSAISLLLYGISKNGAMLIRLAVWILIGLITIYG